MGWNYLSTTKLQPSTVEVWEWISNFIPHFIRAWLHIHAGIKVNPLLGLLFLYPILFKPSQYTWSRGLQNYFQRLYIYIYAYIYIDTQ